MPDLQDAHSCSNQNVRHLPPLALQPILKADFEISPHGRLSSKILGMILEKKHPVTIWLVAQTCYV